MARIKITIQKFSDNPNYLTQDEIKNTPQIIFEYQNDMIYMGISENGFTASKEINNKIVELAKLLSI